MRRNTHIVVRQFNERGLEFPPVALPLGRSEASVRILRAIAKGGSPFDARTLAAVDDCTIKLDVIRRLFSKSEIETAVRARLAEPGVKEDEIATLNKLLDSSWRGAQGGARALSGFPGGLGGYNAPTESHRDTFGGGASRGSGDEPGTKNKVRRSLESADLRKSMAFDGCVASAKEKGWRVSRSSTDGGLVLHHPRKNMGGHELSVGPAGEWQHTGRRGKALASGGSAQLHEHLAKFSSDYDGDDD